MWKSIGTANLQSGFSDSLFFHMTSQPNNKMKANFEHVLCRSKTTRLFFFFCQRDSVASKLKHFSSSPFDLIRHSALPLCYLLSCPAHHQDFSSGSRFSLLLACSNCLGWSVSALFPKISDEPGDMRKTPFS